MQRSNKLPSLLESPILSSGYFERVGHVRIVIIHVRHSARLAFIEGPMSCA
jgi:hypothetical protein